MPSVERNLAILGSPSVGKSALTLRFCKDEFSEIYDPTILKKYSHKVTNNVNHVEYDLTIFDTAGLEQHSQIQTSYINSNGFILVYSIVDRQSFDIVKDVYHKLVEELNGEKWDIFSFDFEKISVKINFLNWNFFFKLIRKPVILIGNKSDLGDQRRVQADEGLALAKEMNASFIETSARHNEVCFLFYFIFGVRKIFYKIFSTVILSKITRVRQRKIFRS